MKNSALYHKLAAQAQRDTHGYTQKDNEAQEQDAERLKLFAAADLAAQTIIACGQPLDMDHSDYRIDLLIDTAYQETTGQSDVVDDFTRQAMAAGNNSNEISNLFNDALCARHETAYFIGLFVGLHFASVVANLPDTRKAAA